MWFVLVSQTRRYSKTRWQLSFSFCVFQKLGDSWFAMWFILVSQPKEYTHPTTSSLFFILQSITYILANKLLTFWGFGVHSKEQWTQRYALSVSRITSNHTFQDQATLQHFYQNPSTIADHVVCSGPSFLSAHVRAHFGNKIDHPYLVILHPHRA